MLELSIKSVLNAVRHVVANFCNKINIFPLVVWIHDGPHEQFIADFNIQLNTLLKMDVAVLAINHRGSTGMGDATLESIITNIGLV